jgi:hypothetical protein
MHINRPVKFFVRHSRKVFTSGIFLYILIAQSLCQKLLPDTIYVSFQADSLIHLNRMAVTAAIDSRNENPSFVRYDTKRRFLLIPVDQEVYTRRPLAEEVLKGIPRDTLADRIFVIEIKKFEVEQEKGRLSSTSSLVADIPVYERINDSLVWRGTLFYDYPYIPEAKKESISQSTENLLKKWHTDFKLDLMSLRSDALTGSSVHSNLVTNPKIKSLYINTGVAGFVGYNWWGLQGEVYFSRPESNSRNHYLGGIIRYQNNPDYQTMAFGKRAEHYILRMNEQWVFDVDLNFLVGLCKWKNVDAENPTLYQIFDFELSSTQNLIFNPLNKKGIVFRLGIIENFSWVIGKTPKFQPGLLFGLGVKL